jgi:transcriptional regulator with XRE-family HTH domain
MHPISKADLAIGEEIRRHRRNAGLTQKEVAARIGITGPQIHRYESGTTRMSTSRLIAIAEVLNMRLDKLLITASAVDEADPPLVPTNASQQIIDLVQMFSSIADPRQRSALMAVARMMASTPQQRASTEAVDDS